MDDLHGAAELAVAQLGVRRGERVAVLHNAAQNAIAEALAAAARAAGGDVSVVGFATLPGHGVEPPEEVARAIAGADVRFTPPTRRSATPGRAWRGRRAARASRRCRRSRPTSSGARSRSTTRR